mgnify:CR=1 FL=1
MHNWLKAEELGWEIVKFFGKPTSKIGDSHTFDMKDSTKGVDKIKKVQEGLDLYGKYYLNLWD